MSWAIWDRHCPVQPESVVCAAVQRLVTGSLVGERRWGAELAGQEVWPQCRGRSGIGIAPFNPNQLYALQFNGLLPAPLLVSGDGGLSWQARSFGPNVVDAP